MSTDVGTTTRLSMSRTRRLRLWERDHGICCLCGQPIDGVRQRWQIEHLRALELGGDDTDKNCAPAHSSCSADKDKADHMMAAKAKRMKARHINAKSPPRNPMPGSKSSRWKKKISGEVVLR
jgi:5-methylcytosine-specific restriction endonuclease McrA